MTLTQAEFHPIVELAADKTADGFLCLDVAGQILYANDAAARALSETTTTLSDKTIFQIAPEMNPSLWRELWKEIRGRSVFAFEFAFASGPDHPIQVDLSVHYLKPATRELACVFFRDIEERKRLQNLQQEFVSTASHELRTPMTVIREGVSQVLEGLRGDINDSQRRALSIALNGIDRLGRIIDELLDISKIESGRLTLKRDRIDLTAVTREIAATFQSLATDRRLELRVTTPAGPVLVYGDRDRLIQVMTNLVGNSFKFTEKGHIQIGLERRGADAQCSISDTGIGFEPKEAEKIFNKFEQLGQTTVTGEKGTGLGLSISRAIVELHKGRIWARSEGPGKGATFTFALPMQAGRDVFRDHLAPMLREVSRRGGSLSTVVFRLKQGELSPLAGHEGPGLLDILDQIVRKRSGRLTDLIVKDQDTMYLALQSMAAREALRIAEHAANEFKDLLKSENRSDQWRLAFDVSGFPEESDNEDVYLEKLFRREAA